MSCDCYETTTTVSPPPPVVSAGVKISQLTSASSLAYSDLFVYVDVSSQQTKNVTFENVIKSINSSFVVDVDTSGTYLRTSGSWVEFDPNTKLDTSAFYPMSAIDHTVIQNIGVYSHSAIDTHIDDLNIHYPDAIDLSTYIRTSGSWVAFDPNSKVETSAMSEYTTTADFNAHTSDTAIHFVMSAIDHTVIQNIGTYAHSAIDTHINNLDIHYPDVVDLSTYIRTSGSWVEFNPNTKFDTSGIGAYATSANLEAHTSNTSIHYVMSAIDHKVIQNIGVYTHSAIDTHINDLTIHFPMSAINGLNPIGGTSGQVLTKNTSGAYDYSWKTPIVSPSNLVYADEGNGLGYWLIGDDRNTKGNIGPNAVDLSYNDIAGMSDIGAVGTFSHAEGHSTLALYHASHAEGYLTSASHNSSHAEGSVTIASGFASHAEGSEVIASGIYSHAEGKSTRATGNASHAEGSDTYSTGGAGSHAEGYTTSATGFASHAEGNGCEAIGESSHAEGNYSKAYGLRSHAEGNMTYSIGQFSHSEGYLSSAIGSASHAQGFGTIALGSNSHAGGDFTIASNDSMFVTGKYNSPKSQDIFEIGVGVYGDRKNAFEVTSAGVLSAPQQNGKIVNDDHLVTKLYVTSAISSIPTSIPLYGATSARPITPATGTQYLDTTLGYPVWYLPPNWVNATGSSV